MNIFNIISIILLIGIIILGIFLFIGTLGLTRVIILEEKKREEKNTEEDEYYKTLIEFGNSSEEIEKIKAFNNDK